MSLASGVWTRVHNYVQDKLNSITIQASRIDAEFDNVKTALDLAIYRDGQTTMSADIPFNDKKITGLGNASADSHALNRVTADGRYPRLVGGTSMATVAAVSASTVDLTAGRYFTKTAAGALTWVFSGPVATGSLDGFILELTNGGTGTQTWPASVDWPGAAAPTLTTSGVDTLAFITRDGGTTWRGALVMRDSR